MVRKIMVALKIPLKISFYLFSSTVNRGYLLYHVYGIHGIDHLWYLLKA